MSTKESKTNCSGEYPAVWLVRYKFEQQIRQSVEGTGETEVVGKQVADAEYHVVAMSAAFAMATFLANCPVYVGDLRGTPADPEFVAYVDAITLTQKNYGGRFA